MKKTITIMLTLIMMCSLAACTEASTEAITEGTKETVEEMKEVVNEEVSTEDAGDVASGIRPEFKKAMDDYEAFYDEYCDFMKKYKENPSDLSLITEYADMAAKLIDMDEAFEEWDQDDLSQEELKYYLEVSARIAEKLVDAAA